MRGYTLIEVVIALAIFAILGTLSVGLLSRAFETKTKLATQVSPLTDVQLAATRISQDANQMVARAVRDQDMKKISAFVATTQEIEFTRGGFVSADKKPTESTLRRVALSCENHKLLRKTWSKLDGFERDKPQTQTLLTNLERCSFAFTSSRRRWSDEWRGDDNTLPASFKLYLEVKDIGEVALIFAIPGGSNVD